MSDLKAKFKKNFPQIRFEESLKPYSTFKIGGPADLFYILKNLEELPKLIKFARANKIPFLLIGAGSNILFADKGFRGLIIKMEADKIEIKGGKITADAGILINKLVSESIKNGLSGLEKWITLPGTVGGSVYGNAGCSGLMTADILERALIFYPKSGRIREVKNNYFKFKYRESILKKNGAIVLRAVYGLRKAKISPASQQKMLEELRKWRLEHQPVGFTTGSFFKNPSPQKSAGLLIDQCGLKGKTIGKAKISEKHANFFMNTGNASAKDIIALAMLAKREVKAKFGLNLREEVQIISETEKDFLTLGKASRPLQKKP